MLLGLIHKSSEPLLPWATWIFRSGVSNSRRSFDILKPQWTGCDGHDVAKEMYASNQEKDCGRMFLEPQAAAVGGIDPGRTPPEQDGRLVPR